MATRDQPYMAFYTQDFLCDEKLRQCSAESAGVYIMLICVMRKMEPYGTVTLKSKEKQSKSKISDFAIKISKHLPYSKETIERALDELISEKVLTLDGDTLYQKRMVKDASLSTKRANAGRKGGKAKTSKQQANTENEYEDEIENEYEYDLKEENLFADFWSVYPKKVGKGAAQKAWDKINPGKKLSEEIIESAKKQKSSKQWEKDDGQYIPNPATWLNQRRWEDELDYHKRSYNTEELEEMYHWDVPDDL